MALCTADVGVHPAQHGNARRHFLPWDTSGHHATSGSSEFTYVAKQPAGHAPHDLGVQIGALNVGSAKWGASCGVPCVEGRMVLMHTGTQTPKAFSAWTPFMSAVKGIQIATADTLDNDSSAMW